jgi:hypothetical protein
MTNVQLKRLLSQILPNGSRGVCVRLVWFAIGVIAVTAQAQAKQPGIKQAPGPSYPTAKERLDDKPKQNSTGAPALVEVANKSEPDAVKLYLMDGSLIAGKLTMKEIPVETQFGNLSVPVANIKSLTPGLSSHPELAKRISNLIADLGSGNYNDRERAQQALLKLGLSIRNELERYQNDSDVERRTRVKAILAELDQLADDNDSGDSRSDLAGPLAHRDTIETTEFTIVGKIVPQSFPITSPYGELNIKLSDIRRAQRDTGQKEDLRQTFGVDATHFASRNPMSTNIRLERGDVVTIAAEGTLNMTPWGAGAISTPDGAPNYGWYIPNQIASGTLVGRIGNEGFRKLGSKTTFTVERGGVLHLGIGMQNDYTENQFPGTYNVKVRVQRKQER